MVRQQAREHSAPPAPGAEQRHTTSLAALPAVLLAVAAGVACWCGSAYVEARLLSGDASDVWFEADIPRVMDNLLEPDSVHSRAAVHPLFALFVQPPVAGLRALGLPPIGAVRLLRALAAAANAACFYVLLRSLALRRLDAVLFTLLAGVSAGSIFWFTVPETYAFGALSILLALLLISADPRGRLHPLWDVAALILTFAFTITNLSAGVAAVLVRRRPRRMMATLALAIPLVLFLLIVQQQLFPAVQPWPSFSEEHEYLRTSADGGAGSVLRVFFVHSVVMPEITTRPSPRTAEKRLLTIQPAPLLSGKAAFAAQALWGFLLSCGTYAAIVTVVRGRRSSQGAMRPVREDTEPNEQPALSHDAPTRSLPRAARSRFVVALLAIICGQLVLHLLYGQETFLYAAHYAPPLLLMAALGAQTEMRGLVLILAGLLLLLAAWVNLSALQAGVRLL